MKRSIIVIDDFYNKPDEVRKIALNSSYPEPQMDILILVKILMIIFIQMNCINDLNKYLIVN